MDHDTFTKAKKLNEEAEAIINILNQPSHKVKLNLTQEEDWKLSNDTQKALRSAISGALQEQLERIKKEFKEL